MEAETTGTRDGGRLRWALPLALAGIVTEGVDIVRASLERLGHDKAGRARLVFVLAACVAVATLVRATTLYGPVVVVGALVIGGLLARRDVASWFACDVTPQIGDAEERVAAVTEAKRVLAEARGR